MNYKSICGTQNATTLKNWNLKNFTFFKIAISMYNAMSTLIMIGKHWHQEVDAI